MPTGALAARALLLRRAIESLCSQTGVRAIPIVVVNGPYRDKALIRALERDRRLKLVDLDEHDLPGALHAGRRVVDTEWFSALDDDDECLPGGLSTRVRTLESNQDCDAVVSRGIVRDVDCEYIYPANLSMVRQDPLEALSLGNWLLPGAWLCRTDRVGVWLFEGMPRYLECTYLAMRFSLHCKVCFTEHPSVLHSRCTPGSESKSNAYVHGQVPALERLLELPVPSETKRWLRRVKSGAAHSIAAIHLRERALLQAWCWHLRSMSGGQGWRHASFSLRLLRAMVGSRG